MNSTLNEKRRSPFGGLLIIGLILLANISYAGGTQWWLTSMVQTTEGKYIFESKSKSDYLAFGIMGRGERWTLSMNVPLITQQNGAFTQISEITIVSDSTDQTPGGMHGGGGNQHDPITEEVIEVEEIITPNRENGIGDIYLFGNIKLFGKTYAPAGVFLNAQLKFPIASFEKGLGSGEYDFGLSLSIKQSIKTINIIGDAGFLVLGDPDEFEYEDPFTWGIGIGKSFKKGKFYTLLYYQQYSKILEAYDPPQQLSVGINYRINSRTFISVGWLKGFSETSPNSGFSGGIQVKL